VRSVAAVRPWAGSDGPCVPWDQGARRCTQASLSRARLPVSSCSAALSRVGFGTRFSPAREEQGKEISILDLGAVNI
jgi:hypothetical protein